MLREWRIVRLDGYDEPQDALAALELEQQAQATSEAT